MKLTMSMFILWVISSISAVLSIITWDYNLGAGVGLLVSAVVVFLLALLEGSV